MTKHGFYPVILAIIILCTSHPSVFAAQTPPGSPRQVANREPQHNALIPGIDFFHWIPMGGQLRNSSPTWGQLAEVRIAINSGTISPLAIAFYISAHARLRIFEDLRGQRPTNFFRNAGILDFLRNLFDHQDLPCESLNLLCQTLKHNNEPNLVASIFESHTLRALRESRDSPRLELQEFIESDKSGLLAFLWEESELALNQFHKVHALSVLFAPSPKEYVILLHRAHRLLAGELEPPAPMERETLRGMVFRELITQFPLQNEVLLRERADTIVEEMMTEQVMEEQAEPPTLRFNLLPAAAPLVLIGLLWATSPTFLH